MQRLRMYAQRLRYQLLQPRLHRNYSRTNFFVRNEHPALLQILHGKITFAKKRNRRFKSGGFFLSGQFIGYFTSF